MARYRVVLRFRFEGKNYLSQVTQGIFRRSHAQPNISYELLLPWHYSSDAIPKHVEEDAAGAVTEVRWDHILKGLKTDIPTITVGPGGITQDLPWIGPDYQAIANMACDFFEDRGYTHLEYFHGKGQMMAHSQILYDAVQVRAASLGMTCGVFEYDTSHVYTQKSWLIDQLRDLVKYLKNIPHPCAFFAPDDHHAWRLAEACRLAGLNVPRDVSILGVRSDDYVCEFAKPTLSHIYIDYLSIGQTIADKIEAHIAGKPIASRTLVGNIEVRERGSTSMHGQSDPVVIAAMKYLEANLQERINLDALAQATHVSRSTLIRRFNDTVHKSPAQILRNLRLNKAKHLLRNSNIPLAEVALRCGLSDQSQLNRMIRAHPHGTATGIPTVIAASSATCDNILPAVDFWRVLSAFSTCPTISTQFSTALVPVPSSGTAMLGAM